MRPARAVPAFPALFPIRSAILACLAIALPCSAAAAVHVVTSFGDSGAAGQLRALINAAVPGDTILIPPGTIVLSGPALENANAGGDLDINKALTIVGAGAGLTVIDANGIDRAFHVLAGGHLVLSGVTIRNGAVDPETGGGGGAVFNAGVLHLTLSVIERSSSGGGGGLFNLHTGQVTIESTTFRGNSASGTTGAGGAIMSLGLMTIGTSTFTDNATLGPSASANGGAISNLGDMALTNVTISGNRSFGHAGGIFQGFSASALSLRNVTIADNYARLFGGGMQTMGPAPKTEHTIIGGNRADVVGPDCSGTIASDGHNLIGDSSGCTVAGTMTGNVLDVNPRLVALADNGGPTLTHALRRGSPALDGGANATCAAQDQRGVLRPQAARGGTAVCDIGAVEMIIR